MLSQSKETEEWVAAAFDKDDLFFILLLITEGYTFLIRLRPIARPIWC